MLVLAVAALFAEACSSSNNGGTGGAGGSSSMGGATGTGGKTDGGTSTGGMTGTGGKTDGGTGGVTGTGGKTDGGTGGMTGTDASDAPMDMSITDTGPIDTSVDGDPGAMEKALCATQAYMTNAAPPFTAVQFCTLYREICSSVPGITQFATEADCEAAYNGYSTDAGTEGPNGQKGCRTYHLCNANQLSLTVHCPHATGLLSSDGGPGGPCP